MFVLRLSLWFGPNTDGLWGMTVSGSDALLKPWDLCEGKPFTWVTGWRSLRRFPERHTSRACDFLFVCVWVIVYPWGWLWPKTRFHCDTPFCCWGNEERVSLSRLPREAKAVSLKDLDRVNHCVDVGCPVTQLMIQGNWTHPLWEKEPLEYPLVLLF